MKRFLVFLGLSLLVWWCWPEGSQDPINEEPSVVLAASELVGAPYRAGGNNPDGFDCSGLMSYVFEKCNRPIDRDSRSQALQGKRISLEEAIPGDLIFFKGSDTESDRIGHVGIIVSASGEEVEVIHACDRGVVREQIFQLRYYQNRFVMVRRM